MRRYTESRSAGFMDWHPTRRELLVGTRFANVAQVHRGDPVDQPAVARRVDAGQRVAQVGELVQRAPGRAVGLGHQLLQQGLAIRLAQIEKVPVMLVVAILIKLTSRGPIFSSESRCSVHDIGTRSLCACAWPAAAWPAPWAEAIA